MKMFSLRTIIDDIMLLVRNNNISESEDLSRAQIAAWIIAYKHQLVKQQNEADKQNGNDEDEDSTLESFRHTYGPLELVVEESESGLPLFRKRTKDPIPTLVDNAAYNLYAVFDEQGCIIQLMNEHRRHYHFARKYTWKELTAWYENGYVYVEGMEDKGQLEYIWITGLFEDNDGEDDDMNEDDITVPGWMVPDIKKRIMENELAFMLRMISDDDNNSTLDGIKPQPQTQIGNEK